MSISSAIVEARPYHCGQMARLMRAAQRESLLRAGLDPRRELSARFQESYLRRAWLVDGRLAALGGITGTRLSASGFIWLVIAEEARRYPRAVVEEARRQLGEVMRTKREVATAIVTSDPAALRLAAFLGFHVAHQGPGAPASGRRERRALIAEVTGNPDLQVPLGAIKIVGMGYHRGVTPCA